MSGDQLNVSVDYFYTATNADNSGASGLNSFINNLATVINGSDAVTQGLKSASSTIVSGLSTSSTVSTFFAPENASTGGTNAPPKAYLHVLLFDERFGFDNTNSFVQQVSYSPNTAGTITKALLNVVKSGYAYIYFSNESNEMVYFDNFKLSQVRGPLLEETHYYPFGLTMAGISSKSAGKLENLKKYNKGSELQHQEFSDGSGLEWYDTHYRQLDVQLGRWNQIDPKCEIAINPDVAENDQVQDESEVGGLESVSPYISMGNDPIKHNDPNGDIFGIDNLIGAAIGAVVEIGTEVVSNAIQGKGFVLDKGAGYKIAAAAFEGFVSDGASNVTKALVKVGVAVVNSVVDNHDKGAGGIVKGVVSNLVIGKIAGGASKLTKNVESKTLNKVANKIVGSKSSIIKNIVANNNISHKTANAIAKAVNSGEKAIATKVLKEANQNATKIIVGGTASAANEKISN